MSPVIRLAEPGDWARIWPLWHRVVAAGETYMWDPATDRDTAERLWMAGEVFVVEDGADVVATALLKPNQPGLGDHIANAGFMVDPDHAGRGIGRQLAVAVVEHARAAGYRGMQFNAVISTNTGAVALWTSLGFEVVATIPDAFRHPRLGPVPVHIMYRRL
ncbi:GNAT family N-acetyltransferase [Actinokineospora auranticolor]|uniref:L-amino acid N-acyltransferase YncA n=1 Tax=Actinokineospora auranticolor TaxID=155976 RepID=A0A2S6GXE0_9PSEU|nr:GNAT family N-acetyltransferase [Actinokineospora auranticolor]PPK69857.1 L-amino acid N-acyltransferase YncA [Actinokineospora auranticolor]